MTEKKISGSELAERIDHTLLKPDATPEEVDFSLCEEAMEYPFASATLEVLSCPLLILSIHI